MHGLLRGALLAVTFFAVAGVTAAQSHGVKPTPHQPPPKGSVTTSHIALRGTQAFHVSRLTTIATQVFRFRHLRTSIEDLASAASADVLPNDPSGPPGDAFVSDRQALRSIAAAPLSDAVSQVCGATATICAVWWPGAMGDAAGYQECLRQRDRNSDEPDFGETPAESCAGQFTGDCDAAATSSEDATDLCNLVKGMGVQWAPQYRFGSFATSGDCTHFDTIDQHDKNVIGLRLKDAPFEMHNASATPAVSICAGTLFLLGGT